MPQFLNTGRILLALLVTIFQTSLLAATADESMDKALAAWETKNYQEALEIWLLKAYDGDPEAQYRLGEMFADGTGTVVDQSEAVYWYSRATDQGHAAAQYKLGNAYFHGVGTKPDKAKALEWWHIAAENGNREAQYHLGRAYFYGIDVQQNSKVALDWFERSAQSDYQQALDFLVRVGSTNQQNEVEGENTWTGYGRISGEAIRVYAGFNRLSPILTTLDSGSLLRVVEQNAGWFRAQFPGGLPVWVPSENVVTVEGQTTITGSGIQARPDPGTAADVKSVGIFLDGDAVLLLESRPEWSKVQSPESMTGWVEVTNVVELPDDEFVAKEWKSARDRMEISVTSSRSLVVLNSSESEGSTVEEVEEVIVEEPADEKVQAVPSDLNEVDEMLEVASAEVEQVVASDDPRFLNIAGAAKIKNGNILRVGPNGMDVYARSRESSARIDRLPAAMLLRVIEKKSTWLKVEVAGGLPLWIYSRFLDRDGNDGRITGRGVRARPLPSTTNESQPVGNYPTGATVRVLEDAQEWVRIRAPESIGGWVQINELYLVEDEADNVKREWQLQALNGPQTLTSIQAAVAEEGANEAGSELSVEVEDVIESLVTGNDESNTLTTDLNEAPVVTDEAPVVTDDGEESDESFETNDANVSNREADNDQVDTDSSGLSQSDLLTTESAPSESDVNLASEDELVGNDVEQSSLDVDAVIAASETQDGLLKDSIDADTVAVVDSANESSDSVITSLVENAEPDQLPIDLASETLIQNEIDVALNEPVQVDNGLEVSTDLSNDITNDPLNSDDVVGAKTLNDSQDNEVLPQIEVTENSDEISEQGEVSIDDRSVPESITDTDKLEGEQESTLQDDAVVLTDNDSVDTDNEIAEVEETDNSITDAKELPEAEIAGINDPSDLIVAVEFDSLNWLYSQQGSAFAVELMRDISRDVVIQTASQMDTELQLVAFSKTRQLDTVYNLMIGPFANLLAIKEVLLQYQSRFEEIRIRRLGTFQIEWCERVDNLTPDQLLIIVDKCLN